MTYDADQTNKLKRYFIRNCNWTVQMTSMTNRRNFNTRHVISSSSRITYHERPENTMASKTTKLKFEQQEKVEDHCRHETQHSDEAEPAIGTRQVAGI